MNSTHTHTHLCRSALVFAVSAMTLLASTSSGSAQTRRFKVTPIRVVGFTPLFKVHGYAGINNKGQVAYGYLLGGFPPQYQAFVWLPESDYGFAAGTYDLDVCDTTSIARDINESGFIVGQSGALGSAGGRAAVWQLASGDIDCTELDTFSVTGTPFSSAFAISDDSPPIIVGDSAIDAVCLCKSEDEGPTLRAFYAEFAGGSTILDELEPGGSHRWSQVRDVTSTADAFAGFATCIDDLEFASPCTLGTAHCPTGEDGAFWDSPSSPDVLDKVAGSIAAEVEAINNNHEMVGFGFFPAGLGSCSRSAWYWESSTDDPVDLGDLLPTGNQSFATGINNAIPPQVVGANYTSGFGQLWEKVDDEWDALGLNTSAAIGSATAYWQIWEAHDINDDGWIVAIGTWYWPCEPPCENPHPFMVNGQSYMVLLTPTQPCPADIFTDGCVNMDDLLLVIAHWNTVCPVGQLCVAGEITGDYMVNIDDLLAVNGSWCSGQSATPCCENCPSSFMGGGDPPTVEEIIQLVLESEHSSEVQLDIVFQLLEHFN